MYHFTEKGLEAQSSIESEQYNLLKEATYKPWYFKDLKWYMSFLNVP